MPGEFWTQEEIDFLKKAYQQGLRLKDMALLLKRSATAVNKAMGRFSVRQQSARSEKKNSIALGEFCKMISEKDEKIENKNSLFSFQLHRILSKKEKARSLSLEDKKNVSCYDFSKEALQRKTKASSALAEQVEVKKKIPHQKIDQFVSFDMVIHWLEQKEYRIERVKEDFSWIDHPKLVLPVYKVTSSQKGEESACFYQSHAQLLIFVNKLRRQEALPLFYVINMTAE